MPKTLSTDPVKRRKQVFQNIFAHYYQFKALYEDYGVDEIQTEDESISFHDLLVGLNDLPPRQRQAFELHLLMGYTEVDAWKLMEFTSSYTTLVGQYSMAALDSMIRAYDKVCSDRVEVFEQAKRVNESR